MPRTHRSIAWLLIPATCLGLLAGAEAADLEATGGLYLRLPFAADGSGPERPRLRLGVGPSALPAGGLLLEMDSAGETRLGLVGHSWSWQLPPPRLALPAVEAQPPAPEAWSQLPKN